MRFTTLVQSVRALPAIALLAVLAAANGCAGGAVLRPVEDRKALGADLAWFEPEFRNDVLALGAWRRSVGPPVVVSAAGESRPADRLVVVNWNMHVGGGELARLFSDVRRAAGPDVPVVFLLQEAYRDGSEVPSKLDATAGFASMIRSLRPDGGREDVEILAAALGLHAYYVPSMRNGDPLVSNEDRGNAILSTVPLTGLAAIELPFERQRRVAVSATVNGRTPDGRPWRVRVVSAHLDNMMGIRRLWIAGGEFGRTRQARGLLSALPSDGPLILGADLNSWFGFRDSAYLTAARAFPQTHVTDRRATFHGLLRLDHLFFRLEHDWTARFHRADESYGSDHYPLIGTVHFGTPAIHAHAATVD